MESAQAALERPIHYHYAFHARVTNVEEHFVPAYIEGTGIGKDAQFIQRSLGWFVFLEGSHEALHLGMEKPEIQKGDRVKITLEKVNG